MRRRPLLLSPLLTPALMRQARAQGAAPTHVLELFTSQSCSSCPPADDLLARMVATRPEVLALSLHVTYWNRLGWRDRFSLQAATERQRRYAVTLGHGQVYTPQIVVQGHQDAVGSNRLAVEAAMNLAPPLSVPLALRPEGPTLTVELPERRGAGQLWLIGHDARHSTDVAAGENGGRRLQHVNVVRSLAPIGRWQGSALRLTVTRPEGERLAVLLQAADGTLVGAARAS